LIGVYFDEMYNETKHSLLYDLGVEFSPIQIGVLERSTFRVLDRFGLSITVPDFVVFSNRAGGYFPSTALQGIDITDPQWMPTAREYLTQVENGSLHMQYVTEDLTGLSERWPLTRLSAATYGAFVDTPDTDVSILFYVAADSEDVVTKSLQLAGQQVLDSGCTTMKFGLINVRKNACDRETPPWAENPQLFFFRADNKTNPIPYFGEPTTDALLRFFKAKAAHPISVTPEKMSVEAAAKEKERIAEQLFDYPKEVADHAFDYLEYLNGVINGTQVA
jgi:hypothetical protein